MEIMSQMDELVDILRPPTFEKTGIIKTKDECYDDGDWCATFNLWLFRTQPEPAILYQLRGRDSSLAPNTLDVTIGGHYLAGEDLYGGLREAEEELGRKYSKDDIVYMGSRIYIGEDEKKRIRKNLVRTFYAIDNSPFSAFKLQESEVDGLYVCPIDKVIDLHAGKLEEYTIEGIDNKHKPHRFTATLKSFPYTFDNYHYKIARLAKRIINGEKDIFV